MTNTKITHPTCQHTERCMQADEALRHCMLKHFGTNQSCEIKVLEVTQFCQEKKNNPTQKDNKSAGPQRFSSAFISNAHLKKFLAWKYLLCAKQQKKEIAESARIHRKIYPGLLSVRDDAIRSEMQPTWKLSWFGMKASLWSPKLCSQVSLWGRVTEKAKTNSTDLQMLYFGAARQNIEKHNPSFLQ